MLRLSLSVFALCVWMTATTTTSAQTELLMHLRLDDSPARNGSTLLDSSPNGNNATVINNNGSANKTVNGVNEFALHFDGSGDRVDTPAFDIDDSFSVAFWIKPENTFDGQAFIGKHTSSGANQLLVGIYQGGYHVNLQGQQFTAGASELSTDWQHIVVTAVSPGASGTGSTDVRFYKDGWPLWTNTVATVIGDVSGGKGWTLGQDWDGSSTTSDFFTGEMDDVAVFNGALSGGQAYLFTRSRTINVTTTADVIDANDGLTSLREAVIEANEWPGSEIINLTNRTYRLTLQGVDEDASATGDLDVTDTFGTLTIQGAEQTETTIHGNGTDRIFHVHPNVNIELKDMTLREGVVVGDGGAVLAESRNHLTGERLTIFNNQATQGGGVYSGAFNRATFSETQFEENTATGIGGGYAEYGAGVVHFGKFLGNQSGTSGGGAAAEESGVAVFYNSLFVGNTTEGDGGALSIAGGGGQLVNSTLVENMALQGGGIWNGIDVELRNCLVWGNKLLGGSASQIEGNPLASSSGANLIEGAPGAGDPVFTRAPDPRDGDWRTRIDNDYGDLRGLETSATRNAGDNNYIVHFDSFIDLDGLPRISERTVDIGAYETQVMSIYRIDAQAAAGVQDGLSWGTAFADLQDALVISVFGDQVWLKSGTYKPAGPGGDRAATFLIPNGVQIYGGFSGDENSVGERDSNPDTNGTILSGDLNGDGNETPDNDDNSYHVVSTAEGATTSTRLDGLTIQGGHADGGSWDNTGAGALVLHGDPYFIRVSFKNNRAASRGGGVHNYRGAPRFESCEFFNNDAYKFTGSSGGGMYSDNSATSVSPRFYNCDFRFNTAAETGGGLYLNQSDADLSYVTFSDHFSNRGGGLYIYISSPRLVGVSFDRNQLSGSEEEGGAVFVTGGSSPTYEDVTFTANSASEGGAMYCLSNSTNTLINVDFINNRAVFGGAVSTAINTRFHQSGGSFVGNGSLETNTGGGIQSISDDLRMIGVTFSENETLFNGGHASLTGNSTLINCTFTGGDANRGAGIYMGGGDLTVVNSVFTSNSAQEGGALYFTGAPTDTYLLRNISVAGNISANLAGGGMRLIEGQLDMANSILWGNRHQNNEGTSQSSMWVAGGTATISDSIIQGSNGSGASWAAGLGVDGGGNLDIDPLFVDDVDPTAFPRPAWDLRLWKGSPALNVGANASLPSDLTDLDNDQDAAETIPLDRANRQRILGANVDMGALEGGYTTFARTHPGLDPSPDDNNNGLSNFEDYTVGNDPLAPAAPIKPFQIDWDDGYPIIGLTVRGNAIDTSHTVESSLDFERWRPIAPSEAPLVQTSWPSGDASVRVLDFELLRNSISAQRFYRLRIDPPNPE